MTPTTRGLTEIIRELLAVFEAGAINSAQRDRILGIRVLLGDAVERCLHPVSVYEEDDRLICQACRAVLEPSSI